MLQQLYRYCRNQIVRRGQVLCEMKLIKDKIVSMENMIDVCFGNVRSIADAPTELDAIELLVTVSSGFFFIDRFTGSSSILFWRFILVVVAFPESIIHYFHHTHTCCKEEMKNVLVTATLAIRSTWFLVYCPQSVLAHFLHFYLQL